MLHMLVYSPGACGKVSCDAPSMKQIEQGHAPNVSAIVRCTSTCTVSVELYEGGHVIVDGKCLMTSTVFHLTQTGCIRNFGSTM